MITVPQKMENPEICRKYVHAHFSTWVSTISSSGWSMVGMCLFEQLPKEDYFILITVLFLFSHFSNVPQRQQDIIML
jgi:hypothetical protein